MNSIIPLRIKIRIGIVMNARHSDWSRGSSPLLAQLIHQIALDKCTAYMYSDKKQRKALYHTLTTDDGCFNVTCPTRARETTANTKSSFETFLMGYARYTNRRLLVIFSSMLCLPVVSFPEVNLGTYIDKSGIYSFAPLVNTYAIDLIPRAPRRN